MLALSLILVLPGASLVGEPTVVVSAQSAAESEAATTPLQIDDQLQVEGRLVPRAYIDLSFSTNGPATAVLVQEGDQVQVGDLLLRIGDLEQLEAEVATARYELLVAQQELDDLYLYAGVQFADAEKRLAEAQKTLAFAEDKVESLEKPTPQDQIEQAYANLILAENRLNKVKEDLRKIEKRYKNKNSIYWFFLDQHDFKDIIEGLERAQIYAQRRYDDALEKYEDLLKPVDAVDLAMAKANLTVAQSAVADAQREVNKYQNGPDPDQVLSAQARITAAEARLAAAEKALTEVELTAPISGKVVAVNVKAGEWVNAFQPVVVLADDDGWVVETEDLTELEVVGIQEGQPVIIVPEALPELELSGALESVKDLSEEKRGDVTYTARIPLKESDPRLRWGMTMDVIFPADSD